MLGIRDGVVLSERVASTEDKTTTLSQNVWRQSSTDEAPYPTITETSPALVQLRLTYIAELTSLLLLNVLGLRIYQEVRK